MSAPHTIQLQLNQHVSSSRSSRHSPSNRSHSSRGSQFSESDGRIHISKRKSRFQSVLDPEHDLISHALLVRTKPPHFHHPEWRGQLCRFLHLAYLHHFMNLLLVIDIAILITSMQIELYHLESEIDDFDEACHDGAHSLHGYGNDYLLQVEEHLMYTSVGILSFFGLEIALCLIGEGLHYLSNPLHCLDIIVVSLSLFFELHSDSFASTILILIRVWRFLRLVHGTMEMIYDSDSDCEDDDRDKNDGDSNKKANNTDKDSAAGDSTHLKSLAIETR